jgi:MFS family permease
MTISVGFNFHGLNAFALPLSDTFGVALPTVVGVLSVARIETAFIGPLEGYLVDRFGPRTMMFIGVPIMGVGFLATSLAPSFPVFVVAFLFGVVLGTSLGFGNPIATSVANWWQRKRGRAFGILWLGTSLASMIVPVVNWMIETFGWRGAFRIMGAIVFLVGLPIAGLMRHRPEQYGMLPDGDDPNAVSAYSATSAAESGGATTRVTETNDDHEFTVWEAMRTTTFWAFAFSVSMRTGITSAVAINSFPLVVEGLGGTATQASFLFLLQGIGSAPGRVFLSWIGDSINKRYIMASSLAVMSVALLFMSQATTFGQLTLLWIPYSIVWGGLSSLPNSLRADLFGRRNFGTIQGTMSPVQSGFSFATPVFAAWVFQRTGSYTIPFMVFSGMALLSMLLILRATPPRKRGVSYKGKDIASPV